MSLEINGIVPTIIIVEENGVFTELTRLDVMKNGEITNCWLKPLATPVISGTLNYDSTIKNYYFVCNVKNNNSCAVKAHVFLRSSEGYFAQSSSIDIPANSTKQYFSGKVYRQGVKVQVTFSAEGYADSSSSTTFGVYNDSDDGTDETTTTTTTP